MQVGETAQTLAHAFRRGVGGTPRLVYAELDDGFIPQAPVHDWISDSGAPLSGWRTWTARTSSKPASASMRRHDESDVRASKAKAADTPKAKPQKKLSFKDAHRQKEIDELIPKLKAEVAALEKALADPDLYSRDPDAFNAKSARIAAARAEAEAAEMEWLEIEEKREALAG